VQHQTLIVAGEQDPTVPPRNARLLAARLPHARLHVVKGGGHLFLLDEPENALRRSAPSSTRTMARCGRCLMAHART
jgi:pimeloyl-ACP methyl ester carboxylesterase